MGFKARKPPIPQSWRALSNRERECAELLMDGKLTRDEMADEMGCHVKTFDSHRLAVMAQFGFINTVQLVRYGLKHGLTKP